MEPVSTRHGTRIPPIRTGKFGQADIKPSTTLAESNAVPEPEKTPTGLWLFSPVGISFPTAGLIDWIYCLGEMGRYLKQLVVDSQPDHIPLHNDPVVDNVCKGGVHHGESDYAWGAHA